MWINVLWYEPGIKKRLETAFFGPSSLPSSSGSHVATNSLFEMKGCCADSLLTIYPLYSVFVNNKMTCQRKTEGAAREARRRGPPSRSINRDRRACTERTDGEDRQTEWTSYGSFPQGSQALPSRINKLSFNLYRNNLWQLSQSLATFTISGILHNLWKLSHSVNLHNL